MKCGIDEAWGSIHSERKRWGGGNVSVTGAGAWEFLIDQTGFGFWFLVYSTSFRVLALWLTTLRFVYSHPKGTRALGFQRVACALVSFASCIHHA